MSEAALEGFRALDLTDYNGFLCGRMLGDLGVDVIKVEPPGGEPSRRIGPFYKGILDPEKSLYWFAYNANKRGITLNIETADGQEIFKRLVKTAHFVIESFPVGYMDKLGLGYSSLSQINPGIILTSITPFGQTGPYSSYKASDIVVMAMSGLMYLCGDPDRPPNRISFPQANLFAAADAAACTLIAHYYRQTTGEGQWVDSAMQQATFPTTMNAPPYWELNKVILKRVGPLRTGLSSGVVQRQIWPCKGGYVSFPVYGGVLGASTNRSLTEWLDSEGMADDFLRGIDWDNFDMGQVTQEDWDHTSNLLMSFFQSHTVQELYEEALKRNIMIYPVSTPKDLAENVQLKAREYWFPVEHPELGETILYPGASVKASLTPIQIRRRAPLIGEHNHEIYKELGLSEEELTLLKQGAVI